MTPDNDMMKQLALGEGHEGEQSGSGKDHIQKVGRTDTNGSLVNNSETMEVFRLPWMVSLWSTSEKRGVNNIEEGKDPGLLGTVVSRKEDQ